MMVATARCTGGAVALLFVLTSTLAAEDWPQWLGTKRDGVWREDGIVKKFPQGGPKKLWSAPLGCGYAGPAVVTGRVYVQDRQTQASGGKAGRGT